MKKIRTLIIDDEPLARRRIIKLLEQYSDIEILAECKNGREAMRSIQDYHPDLIFLDIQMPDFSGFDVLNKLGKEKMPFIIFVTAFDQYALKAFDVQAVDYLLKPYDNDRFEQALEHARQQIKLKQQAFLHQKVMHLIDSYRQPSEYRLSLEIKDKGVTHHVSIYDVYYLEAHGNYVKVHTAGRLYLLRQTLQALETELDHSLFLRIHRSLLVNTNYIARIHYQGNNQYLVRLKNHTELLSSRGCRDHIAEYLVDQEIE